MENGKNIVIVDGDLTFLEKAMRALKEHYNVMTISSGSKLFEVLKESSPDLILYDLEMPKMDGYKVLQKIKSSQETKNIPVILLVSSIEDVMFSEGLKLGAEDYFLKKISGALLLRRIENHFKRFSIIKEVSLAQKKTVNPNNPNNILFSHIRRKTNALRKSIHAIIKDASVMLSQDSFTGEVRKNLATINSSGIDMLNFIDYYHNSGKETVINAKNY